MERKLIFEWENGVRKEIIVNRKSAEIIAIADIREWCRKNNFKYPSIRSESKKEEIKDE